MTTLYGRAVVIGVLVLLWASMMKGCPLSDTNGAAGVMWQGVVRFPGLESRVVLKVDREASEGPRVSIGFPDQSDQMWPVEACEISGDRVRLVVDRFRVTFDGRFESDGTRIFGQWRQNGQSQDVTLRRVEGVDVAERPQTPKPPFPYISMEIVYENPAAPATLSGTLTLPAGEGPFPAVLLISGGGAQDRDATFFRHKPFWVLADALTREGMAVLRSDDRGVGGSTGDRASATSEDYAQDVLAGVAFLMKRKEIDSHRIGLVGHSEGGLIASMAASRNRDVAFVVMLASPGLPGREYLLQYEVSTGRSLGLAEEAIAAKRALQQRILSLVAGNEPSSEIEQRLRKMLKAADPALPEDRLEAGVRRFTSPWFRFMVRYDPGDTLTRLRCPVLALFGEKDVQVPPQGNAAAVRAALDRGGVTNGVVEILPGLNHFFQACETGSPIEYNRIEQTFSPQAIERLCRWIRSVAADSDTHCDSAGHRP